MEPLKALATHDEDDDTALLQIIGQSKKRFCRTGFKAPLLLLIQNANCHFFCPTTRFSKKVKIRLADYLAHRRASSSEITLSRISAAMA